MVWYKYPNVLTQISHANFDKIYSPGEQSPDGGIFRCEGCGREIGIAQQHTLPPQNHHQHGANHGTIRWRMVACSENR